MAIIDRIKIEARLFKNRKEERWIDLFILLEEVVHFSACALPVCVRTRTGRQADRWSKRWETFRLKFAYGRCIIIVDTFYSSFLKGRCYMQTQIKKWGNSLALRIPKLLALDANLKQNKMVELSIDKDSIIITPIGEKEYSLEKLLKGVTKSNLHGEFNTGASVGKEN